MKKLIFLSLVSLLGLVSCSQNKEANEKKLNSDTVPVAATNGSLSKCNALSPKSQGNVFPTDSLPDYLLINDTLFVFSGDWAFQDPFKGIKTRNDFKRIFKDYKEKDFPDPVFPDNLKMYQYQSANNCLKIGYDENDEDEDSIYVYCRGAEINDDTVVLNGIGSIGRAKSDFIAPFNLNASVAEKVNVMCIVTLLESYYYFINFENDAVNAIKIADIMLLDKAFQRRISNAHEAKYYGDKTQN